MKVLAIESSAGPASCALTEDGRILASAGVHTGLTHSQTLVPMVDGMLKNAGVPLQDVDLLAVAAGPGSFTGVRIGVAAVKGLAFARDIPCVGVSTLAAMARAADGIPFDGVVCAAMDARCRRYTRRCLTAGATGSPAGRRTRRCRLRNWESGYFLAINLFFWLETARSCAIIPLTAVFPG